MSVFFENRWFDLVESVKKIESLESRLNIMEEDHIKNCKAIKDLNDELDKTRTEVINVNKVIIELAMALS